MKGCLYKIILLLVFAFFGLYTYQYFTDKGFDIDDVASVAESVEFSKILESTGLFEEEILYPTPTTYKPMLNSDLVTFPSTPKTLEDFRKVLLYMGNENLLELKINYNESFNVLFEDNTEITDNLTTAFDDVVVEYVDLFSGVSRANYQMEGNIFSSSLTIKLSSDNVDDVTLINNQAYFEESASIINDKLHEIGIIDNTLSQKTVAKVLFTYVTTELAYDETLSKASYTGYGAVKNKTAVCQGYTALYNYLLKLNGIDCFGQAGVITENNTQHIWTIANLDGEKSYIDVTFGDPTPDQKNYTDYKYFDVTKEFLSESRSGVE